MRMCRIQYILWRTKADKLLQNLMYTQILGAGSQLSIGKRTGSPLTKLHIALRVQLTVLPEILYPPDSILHTLSAFNNKRTVAHLCQQQCRKHTGRTKADNYGTMR